MHVPRGVELACGGLVDQEVAGVMTPRFHLMKVKSCVYVEAESKLALSSNDQRCQVDCVRKRDPNRKAGCFSPSFLLIVSFLFRLVLAKCCVYVPDRERLAGARRWMGNGRGLAGSIMIFVFREGKENKTSGGSSMTWLGWSV